jgi:hypothetical protein
MTVIFNQTYLLQTPPVFMVLPVTGANVGVSLSVTTHLIAGKAVSSGTNTTPGLTLTDGAATFPAALPLFVVDNPAAPTVIADVHSFLTPTTLSLSSVFSAVSYFLYYTNTINADFSWSDGSNNLRLTIPTDTILPIVVSGSL